MLAIAAHRWRRDDRHASGRHIAGRIPQRISDGSALAVLDMV